MYCTTITLQCSRQSIKCWHKHQFKKLKKCNCVQIPCSGGPSVWQRFNPNLTALLNVVCVCACVRAYVKGTFYWHIPCTNLVFISNLTQPFFLPQPRTNHLITQQHLAALPRVSNMSVILNSELAPVSGRAARTNLTMRIFRARLLLLLTTGGTGEVW